MVAGQDEKAGIHPAGGEANRKALKLNVSSSPRPAWFVIRSVVCTIECIVFQQSGSPGIFLLYAQLVDTFVHICHSPAVTIGWLMMLYTGRSGSCNGHTIVKLPVIIARPRPAPRSASGDFLPRCHSQSDATTTTRTPHLDSSSFSHRWATSHTRFGLCIPASSTDEKGFVPRGKGGGKPMF